MIVKRPIHIVRHKEVQETIAIEITPGGRTAPNFVLQVSGRVSALKCSIAHIPPELKSSPGADDQVGEAVVVVVGAANSMLERIARKAAARGRGDILKLPVSLTAIQHTGVAMHLPLSVLTAADKKQIQLAVPIKVDQPGAAAQHFNNARDFLIVRVVIGEINPR